MSNDTPASNHELALVAGVGHSVCSPTKPKQRGGLIARGLDAISVESVDFEAAFQNAVAAMAAKQYDRAKLLCEQIAANQGVRSVEANTVLGVIYEHGNGVQQNEKLALDFYLRGVAVGYPRALVYAGNMYADGRGCVKSDFLALDCFKDAALQNDAEGCFNVGTSYQFGHGVEKSEKIAFNWYLKAANLGHMNAQFNVGNMYFEGIGAETNNALARAYWSKAAAQGDADAKTNLIAD